MHEDAAGDAISVYSGEALPAAFCIPDDPPDQKDIKKNHSAGSDKPPLFADGPEYEVRALLRYESVCGLGAFKVPLAEESSGSDGDLRLIYVISDS